MKTTRVAVVGAGVVGLATALHLSQSPEFDVTVLEMDHIASGSSSRSVGIIETQYLEEFDISVRAYGLRFVQSLAHHENLQLVANGYLRLADSDQMLERYEASVERQRAWGINDAQVLSAGEVQALVPGIEMRDRVGGLFGPSDCYVDGYLFANLMGDLARRNGATILQKAHLLGVSNGSDDSLVLETTRGEVTADIVVNAAGAWAGRVGQLLGAPITLSPQRHQAVTVTLDRPIGYAMPSVMDYVPGSGRMGLYFRPEGEAALFAGLHSEDGTHAASDPDRASGNVDPEFIELIAEALAERLPNLDGAGIGHGWAGLFPMSFDQRPVVGPHPADPRVICAIGSGGNGIQLSPAIGKTVCEYLEGHANTLAGPATPWDSARIASGDPALAPATTRAPRDGAAHALMPTDPTRQPR
ncbi:NAD(P)/FAD-dependent oxidoreductase [Nocardia asteroides]|uniref:NAD(P)/FAD-dependent oxidoreductase n=1 Tax=Nocardia asteroides TaxID=1824 RepID=UPI0037CA6ADA